LAERFVMTLNLVRARLRQPRRRQGSLTPWGCFGADCCYFKTVRQDSGSAPVESRETVDQLGGFLWL
jgi:hypothetical protein